MEEKTNNQNLDKDNNITDDASAGSAADEISGKQDADAEGAIQEANNKYLRLYAEFDNYRKRVNKDREELLKYGNESLLYDLLPAIDHLELALKHVTGDKDAGIVQGVEITLKELQRTLEKYGLTRIESAGKCFDPAVHHAMTQVERADMDEKMVVDELRAGYLYRDKVLRPSLVSVSVKPKQDPQEEKKADDQVYELSETDDNEIKINKII